MLEVQRLNTNICQNQVTLSEVMEHWRKKKRICNPIDYCSNNSELAKMLPEKYGPSVQPADLPTTIRFINDIELHQTSYNGDS